MENGVNPVSGYAELKIRLCADDYPELWNSAGNIWALWPPRRGTCWFRQITASDSMWARCAWAETRTTGEGAPLARHIR